MMQLRSMNINYKTLEFTVFFSFQNRCVKSVKQNYNKVMCTKKCQEFIGKTNTLLKARYFVFHAQHRGVPVGRFWYTSVPLPLWQSVPVHVSPSRFIALRLSQRTRIRPKRYSLSTSIGLCSAEQAVDLYACKVELKHVLKVSAF